MKKKKISKSIIVIVVILIIASTFILIENLISKKEVEANSTYYTGFVSRVQKLDDTLAKTSEIESNREIEQMFDVYTSIILVNDRLTLLKENTKSFPDINVLINDFLIFRDEYGYLVKDQLEGNRADSDVHIKVVKQIKLFLNSLPKEYEHSKEFSDQFSAAADHIKPLLHLNF
ncbi:hypothetical protein V4V36_27725 [Paenibacillus lautus]|jgi:uncharacterized alpha/beta hydrolase family protein|uniref:hypothetical protein n=1 Tax=Paenibacillus lautus TaxID=1401 RepID=UPI0010F1A851|nr:hypothetical protein [Paenibacillus lautus]MBY0162090.1 hypothetical protein [Cytobacillus firmus]VTR37851.1 Uncharacterised protein [Actinobacillus pleuropneumoniae]